VQLRTQIENRRRQIYRQGKSRRSSTLVNTISAQELLGRLLAKIHEMASERDRLLGEQRLKASGTNKAIDRPIEWRFR
jgi:hypothetical protein